MLEVVNKEEKRRQQRRKAVRLW